MFEFKDGKIYEKGKANHTNAYMLVYVREEERSEMMKEIPIEEIPKHLKQRFDEENKVNEKLNFDL